MAQVEAFFLLMLLFWIGYERLCELIIDLYSSIKKRKTDLSTEEKSLEALRDTLAAELDKQLKNSALSGFTQPENKALVETLSNNLEAMQRLRDYSRSVKVRVDLYNRTIQLGTYVIAAVIGGILALFKIGLLQALVADGIVLFDVSAVAVFDVIISALVFGGGPSLLHQIIATITEYRTKLKISQ